MRTIKIQQRKLYENANALIDLGKLHAHLSDKIDENRSEQQNLAERVEMLDDKLNQLVQMLQELPSIITEKLNGDAKVNSPANCEKEKPASVTETIKEEIVT